MREILHAILLLVIHDNCRSLPANAGGLALAVRSDQELENLLSCVTIAQSGLKKEKNRGGSRNPATTMVELFVTIQKLLLSQRAHNVANFLDFPLKNNERI